MKLFELGDFKNIDFLDHRKKLEHLFRVQTARCHEINVFILRLARQFPDWWKAEGKQQWEDYPTKGWELSPGRAFDPKFKFWSLPKLGSDLENGKLRKIFKRKYSRMISAKREYEQAGGNYTR